MTLNARGKAKAPISSHPAFPAIVALWFAALLGLGSLVLPVVLLEKIVTATGLGALLPAAQPPLGVTARILIALAAAGLGVIAGLAVARKVAAAQIAERAAPDREDRAARTSAKRPISAREELGISRLDAPNDADHADDAERPAPMPGRRRPLAMSEKATLSDFFDHAPLPGHLHTAEPAPEADPLDLGAFAEPDEPHEVSGPFGSATLSGRPASAAYHPAREDAAPLEAPSADMPPEPEFEEPPVPTPLAAAFANPFAEAMGDPAEAEAANDQPSARSDADLAGRPLGELRLVELVERFALSLQRRAEVDAETDESPLELPQLRAGRATPQPEAPTFVVEPAADIPEPMVEAETLPLAAAIPAALQPISFDDDDEPVEAEPLRGFALSLDPEVRPFARPAPAEGQAIGEQVDAADDAGEASDEDAGYSSLLAMKRPLGAGREFVRIDEDDSDAVSEPVVVFPGQHRPAAPASDGPSREPISQLPPQEFRPFDVPSHEQRATAQVHFATPAMPTTPPMKRADPADTERALRAALEKLQKMSGAG